MAIKISGCNVIDDNRCLVNIASIDTNTKTAIENAGVGGEQYIALTACTNFTNGDPVMCICGTPGAGTAVVPQVLPNCVDRGTSCHCWGNSFIADILVPFRCNPNCFAVISYRAGVCSGTCTSSPCCCANADGTICVSAISVSDVGSVTSTTCLCEGIFCNCTFGDTTIATCQYACAMTLNAAAGTLRQNPNINSGQPHVATSCSGTVSYAVVPFKREVSGGACSTKLCLVVAEWKLCYCTTTCQISIIHLNCVGSDLCASGCTNNCIRLRHYHNTPDQCYTIIDWINTDCFVCNCACNSICFTVLELNDNACFIDCCCSTMVCGPSGGTKAYMTSTCCQFPRRCLNRLSSSASYEVGMALGGFMYDAYGLDGWIPVMLNYDISRGSTGGNQDLIRCGCVCEVQKIWAFKPVANGQYRLTCNCICLKTLHTNGNLEVPFFESCNCCSCVLEPTIGADVFVSASCYRADTISSVGTGFIFTRATDIGNCVKVLIGGRWVEHTSCQCHQGYHAHNCYCIGGNNICYLGGGASKRSCPCCHTSTNWGMMGNWQGCADSRNAWSESALCLAYSPGVQNLKISTPICRALCCMLFATAGPFLPYIYGATGGCHQDNQWNGIECTCYRDFVTNFGQVWIWNAYLDPSYNIQCECLECYAACFNGCAPWVPVEIVCCYKNVAPICCVASCSRALFQPPFQVSNYAFFSVTDGGGPTSTNMCRTQTGQKITTFSGFVDSTIVENTRNLLGVAQNTVSAGGIVCVNTPGQIDNSDFATRYSPTVGAINFNTTGAVACCMFGGAPGACGTWVFWNVCNIRIHKYCDVQKNKIVSVWQHGTC